jgi:hypothetical protein
MRNLELVCGRRIHSYTAYGNPYEIRFEGDPQVSVHVGANGEQEVDVSWDAVALRRTDLRDRVKAKCDEVLAKIEKARHAAPAL